jgi:hypothetical protein
MFLKKVMVIASLVGIVILVLLSAGCRTSSTTTLPPPTTGGMQLTIIDQDQNILSGAKIVSQEQPEGQLKVTGITTNDKNGVTFSDLKPGQYVFEISRADFQGMNLSINVVAGQTFSTTITLSQQPTISINPSIISQ